MQTKRHHHINHWRAMALLITLACAQAAPPAIGAEPVNAITLGPRPVAGQEMVYDLAADIIITQGEQVSRLVQSARLNLSVVTVEKDGSFVVQCVLDRLTTMLADEQRQREFVWIRGQPAEQPVNEHADDDAEARTDAEVDDQSKAEFTAIQQALTAATIKMRLTRDGQIIALGGLSDALGALQQSTALDDRALGLFVPQQFARAISPIWDAEGASGQPHEPGEHWSQSVDASASLAGEYTFTTDWTIEETDNNIATLQGVESAKLTSPPRPDPAAPTIRILEHSGSTTSRWSRSAALLEERTQRRKMASEWTLGDLTMRQTQTTRITLTLLTQKN